MILIYYDFSKIDLLFDLSFSKNKVIIYDFNNLHFFGQLLFNYYLHFFFLVGLILFASMVGSIIILIDPTAKKLNEPVLLKKDEFVFMNKKTDKHINLWK